jgi:hypothetical protein
LEDDYKGSGGTEGRKLELEKNCVCSSLTGYCESETGLYFNDVVTVLVACYYIDPLLAEALDHSLSVGRIVGGRDDALTDGDIIGDLGK